jgi:hypothetical protein
MGTVKQASQVINQDAINPVTTSGGEVLYSTRNRRSLSIQNIGTVKVFVRFGSAPVLSGTKRYSFILSPASAADEGDGGVLSVDDYNGSVWCKTASGTGSVIATDFVG